MQSMYIYMFVCVCVYVRMYVFMHVHSLEWSLDNFQEYIAGLWRAESGLTQLCTQPWEAYDSLQNKGFKHLTVLHLII